MQLVMMGLSKAEKEMELCTMLTDVKVERTVDAVCQVPELLGVVQHFDTLGVGVVAH